MKITFLGTGTSTGIPTIGVDRPVCKSENSKDIRLRSSILINVKQKNILIDCSPVAKLGPTESITEGPLWDENSSSLLFTHEILTLHGLPFLNTTHEATLLVP